MALRTSSATAGPVTSTSDGETETGWSIWNPGGGSPEGLTSTGIRRFSLGLAKTLTAVGKMLRNFSWMNSRSGRFGRSQSGSTRSTAQPSFRSCSVRLRVSLR